VPSRSLAGIVAPNDQSAGVGMVICPSSFGPQAAPEVSSPVHTLPCGGGVL
jgi:hypothetical protein